MTIWHDIAAERVKPQDFYAVSEIPKGCKVKYELDKETGMLMMDRVLYTSTHYPANYGFIPKTYADDHDPLDVLLLCSETLVPLSMVRCFPIGVIMILFLTVMRRTVKGSNMCLNSFFISIISPE